MDSQDTARVVVGVDNTLAGLQALRRAVAEARAREVPLHALRAWTPGQLGFYPTLADQRQAQPLDDLAGPGRLADRFRALPIDRRRRVIASLIDRAEQMTASNVRLMLIIALSYGGRAEIADAARRIALKAINGVIDPSTIDEDTVAQNLYTADIPDPDLLIRTSGEKRISNFLLWQIAYAEMVFLDTLWPDFSSEDFARAVGEFSRRDRRYGAARA